MESPIKRVTMATPEMERVEVPQRGPSTPKKGVEARGAVKEALEVLQKARRSLGETFTVESEAEVESDDTLTEEEMVEEEPIQGNGVEGSEDVISLAGFRAREADERLSSAFEMMRSMAKEARRNQSRLERFLAEMGASVEMRKIATDQGDLLTEIQGTMIAAEAYANAATASWERCVRVTQLTREYAHVSVQCPSPGGTVGREHDYGAQPAVGIEGEVTAMEVECGRVEKRRRDSPANEDSRTKRGKAGLAGGSIRWSNRDQSADGCGSGGSPGHPSGEGGTVGNGQS